MKQTSAHQRAYKLIFTVVEAPPAKATEPSFSVGQDYTAWRSAATARAARDAARDLMHIRFGVIIDRVEVIDIR